MDDISRQYGGQHDQLIEEYKTLTGPNLISPWLEERFDDPLDAEEVLGNIVMVC